MPLLLVCFLLSASFPGFAAPATFVTALPVAENQALVRFNMQPAVGSDGFKNFQFPINIGYGLTPRWALFANLNQGYTQLDNNPATGGSGDLLVFVRNTLYKVDRPKSTFRIAPLAGLSLPTGNNHHTTDGVLAPNGQQSGSGTVDPYLGVTSGYNKTRYGVALDATWRYNPVTHTGYSPGSQFRCDGEFEVTLFPLRVPDEGLPKLFILSLESNYADNADGYRDGLPSQSASKTFSQDAIFELASLHWEAGLGAQFPVMQDFASTSAVRQHTGYYAFFEYYLSTPNWHRRKRG